jgi:hypothetical protein
MNKMIFYPPFFFLFFFGLLFKFIERDQEILQVFLMIFSIESYSLLINYALQYGCNILSKLTRQNKNYENSNISPCKNIIILKQIL